MNLALTSNRTGETLRITVVGTHLNAARAPAFKAGVAATPWEGVTSVEIDLSTVEFLDSSGVGALLCVARKKPTMPRLTRLIHARPDVLAVLELMRLDQVFEWASYGLAPSDVA